MAKSMSVVVPPNAAARVPVSNHRRWCAAKRHVQVRVNVNPAGQNVSAFGIQDLLGGVARKAGADGSDFAAGDCHVSGVRVSGSDHDSVYDECVKGHLGLQSSAHFLTAFTSLPGAVQFCQVWQVVQPAAF